MSNYGGGASFSVTSYPLGSKGNQSPSTNINGAATGLNAPDGVAVGSKGDTYVANSLENNVTVHPAGASGDVGPVATIGGVLTGLSNPQGIALDSSGNLYVANETSGVTGGVTIYSTGSSGNVAPLATIAGPDTGLDAANGIALDSSGNIYVTNGGANSITVYSAGSNGDVAPTATIGGGSTGLNDPYGIALDSGGNIYAASFDGNTVTVYPPLGGRTGTLNEAPSATISGGRTGLDGPVGIALDSGGKIYVANYFAGTITVYPPLASLPSRPGYPNVKPSATISGDSTALDEPGFITIGP